MNDKAITTKPKEVTALQQVSSYMRSDAVMKRFSEVVGQNNVGAYINSVLLAVASSDKLQECTSTSVFISALRAATLRLSCDPSTGQAYLVPFAGKAVLIVGYKGLYDMAVRTGRYRYINVTERYEGQTVEPDPISGLITYDSLGGSKISNKVIGWLGAFEMNPEKNQRTGFAHTLYMTVEDIHVHGKKYSKSYTYKESGWQTDPAAMERKTVLRLLLRRWGYLDPSDIQALESIEAEPEAIDAEFRVDVPAPAKTEAEIMAELGYEKPKAKTPLKPREEEKKETPIEKAIRTFRELQTRADALGLAVMPLPEKVTIDQVRELNKQLTASIVAAELKKNAAPEEPYEPPFPAGDKSPTQPGLV